MNIGYVLGIVSITAPRCSNTVLRKTPATPTSPHARRGGVRNKKRCANAVVHSLQRGTAAACAVPWIQAAPWSRGMPLARNSLHCILPSRRFWTSIRTAKYSRFAVCVAPYIPRHYSSYLWYNYVRNSY